MGMFTHLPNKEPFMATKPSYLGLLNAIAVAEAAAHEYLTAWAARHAERRRRARCCSTVAAREGEHGMSFAKRINELGYEVRRKDDAGREKAARDRGVRPSAPTSRRWRRSELGKLDTGDEPDIFDGFFKDHSIDIRTGELLGRYIAEERDTGRLLRAVATSS